MEDLLNGTDVLLYFDTTTLVTAAINTLTPASFKLVACLTANGFSGQTDKIESASKCVAGFKTSIADKKSWTMDFTGEHLKAAGLAARLSGEEVQKLWLDSTLFWALQHDQTNNSVVYGVVRIDSFSKANPTGAISTFTATLTGIGGVGTATTLQPVI